MVCYHYRSAVRRVRRLHLQRRCKYSEAFDENGYGHRQTDASPPFPLSGTLTKVSFKLSNFLDPLAYSFEELKRTAQHRLIRN